MVLDPAILVNHPNFQEVSDFTIAQVEPVNSRIDELSHLIQNCILTINGIQESCISNESGVLDKLNQLWSTLQEVFTVSKSNSDNISEDLRRFREVFNDLVETHLPQQFRDMRSSLKGVYDNTQSQFGNVESSLEDISRRVQESAANYNILNERISEILQRQFVSSSHQKSAGTKDEV